MGVGFDGHEYTREDEPLPPDHPLLVEVARRGGLIRYRWRTRAEVARFLQENPDLEVGTFLDDVLLMVRAHALALEAGLPDPRAMEFDELVRFAQERMQQHDEQLCRGEQVAPEEMIVDLYYLRCAADPDRHFVCRRLRGVSDEDLPRAYCEAYDALMRRDDPPPNAVTRHLVANELSRMRSPDKKHAKRALRMFKAELMRRERDALLVELKGVTGKERKDKLDAFARHWGRKSIGGVRKAVQPKRRAR